MFKTPRPYTRQNGFYAYLYNQNNPSYNITKDLEISFYDGYSTVLSLSSILLSSGREEEFWRFGSIFFFTISPKMLCPYYRDGITKLATYASLRYTSSLEVYEKKLKMLYNLYDRTTHDERKVVLVAFFLAIGDLKRPTSSTNVPQSFQHFIYSRFMVLCTLKQKY